MRMASKSWKRPNKMALTTWRKLFTRSWRAISFWKVTKILQERSEHSSWNWNRNSLRNQSTWAHGSHQGKTTPTQRANLTCSRASKDLLLQRKDMHLFWEFKGWAKPSIWCLIENSYKKKRAEEGQDQTFTKSFKTKFRLSKLSRTMRQQSSPQDSIRIILASKDWKLQKARRKWTLIAHRKTCWKRDLWAKRQYLLMRMTTTSILRAKFRSSTSRTGILTYLRIILEILRLAKEVGLVWAQYSI